MKRAFFKTTSSTNPPSGDGADPAVVSGLQSDVTTLQSTLQTTQTDLGNTQTSLQSTQNELSTEKQTTSNHRSNAQIHAPLNDTATDTASLWSAGKVKGITDDLQEQANTNYQLAIDYFKLFTQLTSPVFTPVLTGFSSDPNFVISSSGQQGDSFAWRCFNGNIPFPSVWNTQADTFTATATQHCPATTLTQFNYNGVLVNGPWLKIQLDTSKKFNYYTVKSNAGEFALSSWKMYTSTDNTTYSEIVNVTNYTGSVLDQTFNLPQQYVARYIVFQITTVLGPSRNFSNLGELVFGNQ